MHRYVSQSCKVLATYGAMALWLGRWIPNPGVPGSKPSGGSKFNSPFIIPRSIKWVPGTPGDLVVKSKLSPHSGSVALRQLNTIHKKGPKAFFYLTELTYGIDSGLTYYLISGRNLWSGNVPFAKIRSKISKT